MPFVILPTNSASGGYDITNSLRFNSGSSDHLTRTPASAGNRKTWTLSLWLKLGTVSTSNNAIFASGTYPPYTNDEYTDLQYRDNKFKFTGGSNNVFDTTALYRDPSAWYHVVLAVDTTQATDTNRVKFYINGSQVTSFSAITYPAQNDNYAFNNNVVHAIGKDSTGSYSYFNGYISEFYWIDGQALTPSSFGETDFDTGIWKPKAYTGTYGTNGFYLQFKNSASLGTDSSGNGNTFTVNNLTSVDQSTDTPTNNFNTMNPLSATGVVPTNGNLEVSYSTNDGNIRSTFGMATGKWYWEAKVLGTASGLLYGICLDTAKQALNIADDGTVGIYGLQNASTSFAYIDTNGSRGTSAGFPNPVGNDILNFALDRDNNKFYIGINGTFYNPAGSTGNPATGTNPTFTLNSSYAGRTFMIVLETRSSAESTNMNFGSPMYSANSYTDGAGYGNFSYAVPSGYYSLNTKNLATFG
jgi:hypothetical protein